MKLALAAVAAVTLCQAAQAQQTFEEVWQSQWRSQVSGNFLSRRFEPQLKAACKEVWDTAQANMPAVPIKPPPAQAKAAAKAKPSAFGFVGARKRPFRGLFNRRRGRR